MIGITGVATIRSSDLNIEKKLTINNDTSVVRVIKSTTKSFYKKHLLNAMLSFLFRCNMIQNVNF